MAAKRFLEDQSGSDPDHHPSEKRIRTRPLLASVIGEALRVNSPRNFCLALEPMIRRVVNEEVESILQRCSRSINRSPSLRIKGVEASASSFQLVFRKNLLLPIFTGSKIVDSDGDFLQILLVDKMSDGQFFPTSLPHPIKVEIVVLDGDFASDDQDKWSSEEFDSKILKERTGKRPLLAGDCLTVTLRDGIAAIGEIEFTDNSSWIRSRKFRLGARVVSSSSLGLRIRQALTHPFVVKDHRGELYKKHHPPMLDDEVWRLEKIGKDGAFHKKLFANGINTVQDFLKLSTVDPQKLRRILGNGMSEKMWEVTIKHARTCVLGKKHYILQGQNFSVTLNPICQVVRATINGQTYSTRDLSSINRGHIENLVRQAYANWNSLQEVIGVSSDIPLLTQGEQLVGEYPNHHHQGTVRAVHQIEYASEEYFETRNKTSTSTNSSADMGYINWHQGAPVSPGIRYSISGSSSDGGGGDDDLTPRSYNYGENN